MSKFLLDANLSPLTGAFLRETFGFDATHIRDHMPGSPSDEEIAALAKREQRVILTFDQDFGEIYYHSERGTVGIVVLQLVNQTVESVNEILSRFFREEADAIDLDTSLVIIRLGRLRITRSQ